MSKLPGGTVTLVFTDIEDSTRLLAFLGSRYEAGLADHRKLLRDAFSSHHGVEVDTQGDAFFYAFARAHDALAATVEAQHALDSHAWPDDAELRVRMGIHTGEPAVTAEGYVGGDVHLGARICAAAWGEQILLSDATARLLVDNQDASLRDLGEFSLKDIDVPVRLHQVIAPGIRADFPPPRTVLSHPTNLPPMLDALMGRAEDISELSSLLSSSEVRVVTLTGPGGVGKTRLSLTAGAELLSSFPDGVFFVDLSALSDPALVTGAIAGALGLRESSGRSLSETLADYIASRQMLLILDNLEHLLDATPYVSALVSSALGLKVLVTSREPLRIAGEHEVPLAPLGLPVLDADAREVAASAAVKLFVARAQALRPSFELTADEAPSVAAICRRLDGLPLAIELAAARTKVLSLPGLASRLEESFAALGLGRRDASDRQRTLRGAIEWSYDLLTPDEQILFRRLGVFAGGFTLEAAEAVCDRGNLSVEVLDGLASLVDKSLVRAREHEDRFVMLETIRSFAADELEASGEADEMRRAHADFFRELAEEAERHLKSAREKEWLDRLEAELGNIGAAVYSYRQQDPLLMLAIGSSAVRLLWVRGHLTEGRIWLSEALQGAPEASLLRAKGLWGLSVLAHLQGDRAGAISAARESLALARQLGDDTIAASALGQLALAAEETRDWTAALSLYDEAAALLRDATVETDLATTLNNMGNVALKCGEHERARSLFEQSFAIQKQQGNKEGMTFPLLNLGLLALDQGSYDLAKSYIARSLKHASDLGHQELIAVCLDASAAVTVAAGDPEGASRLLGQANVVRRRSRISLDMDDREVRDRTIGAIKAKLSHESFQTALTEGEGSGVDDVFRRLNTP